MLQPPTDTLSPLPDTLLPLPTDTISPLLLNPPALDQASIKNIQSNTSQHPPTDPIFSPLNNPLTSVTNIQSDMLQHLRVTHATISCSSSLAVPPPLTPNNSSQLNSAHTTRIQESVDSIRVFPPGDALEPAAVYTAGSKVDLILHDLRVSGAVVGAIGLLHRQNKERVLEGVVKCGDYNAYTASAVAKKVKKSPMHKASEHAGYLLSKH